jgi:TRAP-type C4-dicarboxylate transport system substrate-binding protein
VQGVVTRNASKFTDRQRIDVMKLNDTLIGKLTSQGMAVNTLSPADRATMKAKLSDYYKRWKAEFGNTAWDLMESYTGKLA